MDDGAFQGPTLVFPGDLDGAVVELAGRVADGATWSGTLVRRLETTLPFVGKRIGSVFERTVAVEVKRTADERWRWSVRYPSHRLLDAGSGAGDDEGVDEGVEQLTEIYAIAAHAVVHFDTDRYGVASGRRVDGLSVLGLHPDLQGSVELELMHDSFGWLLPPVPAGPLGVGAMWVGRKNASTDQGGEGETIYVLTKVETPQFTIETNLNIAGGGGAGFGVLGTATMIGDINLPLPQSLHVSVDSHTMQSNGLIEASLSVNESIVVEGGG